MSSENPLGEGTTVEDIQEWLDDGVADGATHMIVVLDTFDYTASSKRGNRLQNYEPTYSTLPFGCHDCATDLLKHLHDNRLVRPPEICEDASADRNSCKLGDWGLSPGN